MKRMLFLLVCVMTVSAGIAQSRTGVEDKLLGASVMIKKAAADVHINPNPVTGKSFTLELQHLDKGKYSILLFNKDGKKFVLSKNYQFEGGSATEIIQLPEGVECGTYILQVISKTSRFIKKMTIE